MRDPKFGYHWIWMLPVGCVLYWCTVLVESVVKTYSYLKVRWILLRNPAIRKMCKLAGIK